MPYPPVLTAMILADDIRPHYETQRPVITGTIREMRLPRLPSHRPHVFVYLCLSEIRTAAEVTLRFVSLDDGQTV